MNKCDCCHEEEPAYVGSDFGNVCEDCWQAYAHAYVQLMDIEIGIQWEQCGTICLT